MKLLMTLSTATALCAAAGSASAVSFVGTLGTNGVFGFDVTVEQEGTTFLAQTSALDPDPNDGDGDTVLSLFDGMTRIGLDDDGGEGFFSRLLVELGAGSYQFFVTGYANVPVNGPTFIPNSDNSPAGTFRLTVADQPGLTVTPQTPVVPLPASVPLLLGALGAFAVLRRRRT